MIADSSKSPIELSVRWGCFLIFLFLADIVAAALKEILGGKTAVLLVGVGEMGIRAGKDADTKSGPFFAKLGFANGRGETGGGF